MIFTSKADAFIACTLQYNYKLLGTLLEEHQKGQAVSPQITEIEIHTCGSKSFAGEGPWEGHELKLPCVLSGAFSPEMAFIMGGGPHTKMRLSSLGSGSCCLAISSVKYPTPPCHSP